MEKTKQPVTVFRNSKPWFEIRSLETNDNYSTEFRDALREAELMKLDAETKTFDNPQELFGDLRV